MARKSLSAVAESLLGCIAYGHAIGKIRESDAVAASVLADDGGIIALYDCDSVALPGLVECLKCT